MVPNIDLRYDDDEGTALWVLAFDPGVTTGWCLTRTPMEPLLRNGFADTVFSHAFGFDLGQISGEDGEYDHVTAMVDLTRLAYTLHSPRLGDVFVVVMEDFILRRSEMDRSLLAPVRIFTRYEDRMEGLVRGSGGKVRIPYAKQSPSDAKNVVTDDRLQRWGLYRPGMQHARDAQRHAVLFSRKWASTPALRGNAAR